MTQGMTNLSLEKAIECYLQPVDGPMRVSFANLITHVRSDGDEAIAIAVANRRAWNKGMVKWQALGGAANLSEQCVINLKELFGASGFEVDEHSGAADARFLVDGSEIEKAVRYLIEADGEQVENRPDREFAGEVNSFEHLFSDAELALFDFTQLGIAVQPPVDSAQDTSRRSAGKPPSRRIFRCFEASGPFDLVKRLLMQSYCQGFQPRVLQLTDNGRYGATLPDGSVIANNLGVPICPYPK